MGVRVGWSCKKHALGIPESGLILQSMWRMRFTLILPLNCLPRHLNPPVERNVLNTSIPVIPVQTRHTVNSHPRQGDPRIEDTQYSVHEEQRVCRARGLTPREEQGTHAVSAVTKSKTVLCPNSWIKVLHSQRGHWGTRCAEMWISPWGCQ